jgi:glycosyltransferase involved in cell wall biosynthesis
MGKSIKVLMIGSDRKLFEDGSLVSERIKEYGTLVEELHIVVFAKRSLGLTNYRLTSNVWIYPTNSLSRWLYVYDAVKLGRKIISKNKFIRGKSIISTQDPFECGLAGYLVRHQSLLPLEVQLHTDPFSLYFTGLLNQVRKVIAKKILRNANSVRVVTTELQSKISRFTSVNISVLPIYVDIEKIEHAPVVFNLHSRYPWQFILLSACRLAPEKNIGMMLQVLKLIHDKIPDVGLVVVGSGPEEQSLRELVSNLNLESSVVFVGWQTDLASYYKTADAYIQASFFEGYGLALVEAGLSGLPVITTPVGVALEWEHNREALIYPIHQPELFAQGIVELIEHSDRSISLRTNLKHRLESELLSKKDYLSQMEANWRKLAMLKI